MSLAGDGVYVVALAWQVYELSDSPTALAGRRSLDAALGLFVLLGGIVRPLRAASHHDRRRRRPCRCRRGDRRPLADRCDRAWHLIALAVVFGSGEAFFGPAFTSIVPQIVPRHLLLQANSLDQFIRPFAFLLVGPAIGGWLVASIGTGWAFVLDACTFSRRRAST